MAVDLAKTEANDKPEDERDGDADLLSEAKETFKKFETAWEENFKRFREDVKFGRLGEQWSDEDLTARRGRPSLRFNQMPTYVRQIVNDARQNKPQISVHPVDSKGDPLVAEVLNGLIRNIEVSSDAEIAYDTAIDHGASGGFGWFRINLAYAHDDAFDLDIRIERIQNPLSVYADPNSTAADSSDWSACFIVEDLTEADFKKRYPDAKETIGWQGGEGEGGWRGDDKIRIAEWWSREEVEREIALLSDGRIVAVEELTKTQSVEGAEIANEAIWAAEGITVSRRRRAKYFKVTHRIITGVEILETVEWPGRYIPIIPVYGEEVNAEGERHLFSAIHWGTDAQKVYNYVRSAGMEVAALQPKAPFIGPKGAFDSDDRWKSANSDNHPYLEYDGPVPPKREAPPQPSAAWAQEAVIARDDIKSTIGIQNAGMGERSNETSGKAIVSRKLESDTSTFHFIDNLSRAIRHAGRVIVDLIPRVYDKPRMVRVLGQDRKQSQMIRVGPGMGHNGGPPLDQPVMAGAPPADQPRMPQPGQDTPNPWAQISQAMDRIWDLSLGKYDVTVSAGPGFTTRREEAATQQMEMIRAFPQLGLITGDIVAKNLDWPGAEEFGERIKQAREMQMQGGKAEKPQADPMQKAVVDAQARVKAAEVTSAGRIQEKQIEVAADQQTEGARIASEERVATQTAAVSAMTGARPPALSPGGNIAR